MLSQEYPQPPSHRTFTFGSVVIDSNFDSGNCSNAQKNSHNNYNLWIGTDNPKNNYRTWFHFSIKGLTKATPVTFNIKNMQNQSRLLSQGLVPVYREEGSEDWKRIKDKVNYLGIEYNEGWIEWSFKHTMTSNQKVFIAFFYPWSNEDNANFLNKMAQKAKQDPSIYFYRTPIIKSLEGRPVQFLVISSNKGKNPKQDKIEDEDLFKFGKKPFGFSSQKKAIVIGARVHPGEVPGSHVMTGIIQQLVSDSQYAKILRDTFVFYLFPIFNPDGVARGHYRVDTNGINLNRCYLNPSAKYHPSIYAVRKIIVHLHSQQKFFAFLDLHAHATRKGTFIYGNSTNQLIKQMQACIFPKIISMNSKDFEYQGSNFTQKNMYCKDRADHMSKQGSGRVAIFKLTKNAYCWTLQCNYNMSRVHNILQNKKNPQDQVIYPTDQTLSEKKIIDYRNPPQKQAVQFFTIQTFRRLGKQVCQSFLDLVQKNPYSRIDNEDNHFKSVQNLKMNLTVALLRMAPNRFEQNFRKVYTGLNSQNPEIIQRSMKALYYIMIKNAKIQNIALFLKEGDMKSVVMPMLAIKKQSAKSPSKTVRSRIDCHRQKPSSLRINKKISLNQINEKMLETNVETLPYKNEELLQELYEINVNSDEDENIFNPEDHRIANLLYDKIKLYEKKKSCNKVNIKLEEFRMIGLSNLRHSMFANNNKNVKKIQKQTVVKNNFRIKVEELPALSLSSRKSSLGMIKNSNDSKVLKKGTRSPFVQFQ